jgi:hypothetical protein
MPNHLSDLAASTAVFRQSEVGAAAAWREGEFSSCRCLLRPVAGVRPGTSTAMNQSPLNLGDHPSRQCPMCKSILLTAKTAAGGRVSPRSSLTDVAPHTASPPLMRDGAHAMPRHFSSILISLLSSRLDCLVRSLDE